MTPMKFKSCNENTGKFKKIECNVNEKFFSKNYSCYVKPVNRTTSFLNMDFLITQYAHHVILSIQLFKKETQHFHPFLNENTGRFKKIDCSVNEKFFSKNYSCYVKPINRTVAYLDMEFYIIQRAHHVIITLQLFKKETQHFRPFLINLKVDACDFLKTKRNNNIIVRTVANYFLPYSNMNFTCPYKGIILFKNFNFDPGFMPSIWPSGYYKATFTFISTKIPKQLLLQVRLFILGILCECLVANHPYNNDIHPYNIHKI
uniref:Uncharacterized protein n=1 Tax=Megaselia scalaris TaxID=36166 RepID=T1GLD9_MEGSC